MGRSLAVLLGVGALFFLSVVALLALAPGAAAQAPAPSGGPDLAGYTFLDDTAPGGPAPDFVDITLTGTPLWSPASGSSPAGPLTTVTLPFPFTWYGHATTSAQVSQKGFLCLWPMAPGNCYASAYPGLGPGAQEYMLAAYAGDHDCLATSTALGSTARACGFYETRGTAPNRVTLVMFQHSGCVGPVAQTYKCDMSFEYKLFEASGCAEVHYGSMAGISGWFAGTEGVAPGGTYTGLAYSSGSPASALSGHAVRYCRTAAPAPLCIPPSQAVLPGDVAGFDVIGGAPPFSWSAPGASPATGSGAPFFVAYPAAGTYTTTVTDSAGHSSTCTVAVQPIPSGTLPACGYDVFPSIPYDFVDVSLPGPDQGLPLALSTGGSAQAVAVTPNPPFQFGFCGATYRTFWASAHGLVCFDATVVPTFSTTGAPPECTDAVRDIPLPSPAEPGAAVHAYHTPLSPGSCMLVSAGSPPASGRDCAWFAVLGAAPDRVLVYMEKGVPEWQCCIFGSESFEVKLFERTGCLEVHYLDVAPIVSGHTEDYTAAGFQNAAGTSGYAYAYTNPDLPAHPGPGLARFHSAWGACPPAPKPDFVTVNEDQGGSFDVTANDGLITGIVAHTLPAKGTLTGPAGPAGGTFTYIPFPDANGPDSFTYTVALRSGEQRTVAVTVNATAVNDPPAFAALPQVRTRSGAQAVPGAAWAVAAGPATAADEAGQAIAFHLESDSNPGLFRAEPTLARTTSADSTVPATPEQGGGFAVLSFDAVGLGSSTLCFRAQDDGGTATTVSAGVTPVQAATGQDLSGLLCMEVVSDGPPVAYFEAPAAAAPGQPVPFDPCPGPIPLCSHDPDGTVLAYAWDFGDGTASHDPAPRHAFPRPGLYAVRLTVTDASGSTDAMTRTVRVGWGDAGTAPADGGGATWTPLADAGPDLQVGDRLPVRVQGRQVDGPGGVAFQWAQVGGPAVRLRNATSDTLEFTPPDARAGEPVRLAFALRLAAGAAVSAADEVVVTVTDANLAPVAAGPGGLVLATAGSPVTLSAERSLDPDGDALTFSWRQVAGAPVALADPSHARLTFTAPGQPGRLAFALRVTDGEAASEETVVVFVQAAESAASPAAPPPAAASAPLHAQGGARAPAWLPVLAGAAGLAALAAGTSLAVLRRRFRGR